MSDPLQPFQNVTHSRAISRPNDTTRCTRCWRCQIYAHPSSAAALRPGAHGHGHGRRHGIANNTRHSCRRHSSHGPADQLPVALPAAIATSIGIGASTASLPLATCRELPAAIRFSGASSANLGLDNINRVASYTPAAGVHSRRFKLLQTGKRQTVSMQWPWQTALSGSLHWQEAPAACPGGRGYSQAAPAPVFKAPFSFRIRRGAARPSAVPVYRYVRARRART